MTLHSTCIVAGCNLPKQGKLYCSPHRHRAYKYGHPEVYPRIPEQQRFFNKIAVGEGCWEWTGAREFDGYGVFRRQGSGKTNTRAHRYSFAMFYGVDPGDFFVCHRCDNPPCVRPDHLFLDTPQGNIADAVAKGQTARGVANGNWQNRGRHRANLSDT